MKLSINVEWNAFRHVMHSRQDKENDFAPPRTSAGSTYFRSPAGSPGVPVEAERDALKEKIVALEAMQAEERLVSRDEKAPCELVSRPSSPVFT